MEMQVARCGRNNAPQHDAVVGGKASACKTIFQVSQPLNEYRLTRLVRPVIISPYLTSRPVPHCNSIKNVALRVNLSHGGPQPWISVQIVPFYRSTPSLSLVLFILFDGEIFRMSTQQPANYSTFAYAYHRQVMAAGVVFPVVGTIIVFLRFWTRLKKKSGLKLDDWLILPALVSGKDIPSVDIQLGLTLDSSSSLAWAHA